MQRKASKLLLACLTLACASHARAGNDSVSQVVLRSGMVMGSFSGAGTVGFTNILYLDGEYDIFTSRNTAFAFRGVLAVNRVVGNVDYAYAGVGQRFFFGANALPFSRTEGGRSVSSLPKLRYFLGWDAGAGQVFIQKVTASAIASSNTIEAGATAGVNWAMYDDIYLQVGGSGSYGYGYTNVSVVGLVIKGFLGVAF
jgi:hypothetical protein